MKVRRHAWAPAFILVLALVSACGGRGVDREPEIKILSPAGPSTIALGETLQVETRSRDDDRVSRVELRVNGLQVDLHEVPKGEKSYRTQQSWLPPDAGSYQVTVVAYDGKGQQSEPATISVTVRTASTPVSPELSTPLLPATPSLSPTPIQGLPGLDDCTYNATFVTDVTVPDNTRLAPGTEFIKTWRLRNSGTCDWRVGFQFAFIRGEQLGGLAAVDVPPVPAGSTVDISVSLRAPEKAGTYRSTWRVRTPDGREFGDRPFVQIVVLPLDPPPPLKTPTSAGTLKPDLDVVLVPRMLEFTVGQSLALEVTVRNHGPAETDRPVLVRAVLQAGLEIEGRVPAIPARGQGVALLNHTFDAPAELEMVIIVDPENEIAEGDEGNNSERVLLVVKPLP